MKTDGNTYSLRSFTGILISAAILPLLLMFYDHLQMGKQYLAIVIFLAIVLLLVTSWIVIIRNTRRAEEALIESNQKLVIRTKELEELNHALEERIEKRTKSLVELQSQLLRSEKFSAIGHLSAGIAHEINNPIGFINSNLQTLKQYLAHYTKLLGILNKLEKALKDHDQQRTIEVVASWEKIRSETNFAFIGGDINDLLNESQQGAHKIAKIVADLRTFASPDRGMMSYVNIEALMESTLNIVYNEIKYKAVLKKEFTPLPLIVCNPQKIGQVFISILVNAAQAIKEKGTITVKTYAKDDGIYIDISDTGCGIAPEYFNKIFDPLFTTKDPGEGMGLGLSLSYDIVRKHHGNISFSSKLGEGTTFSVMLPIVAPLNDPSMIWRDYERD